MPTSPERSHGDQRAKASRWIRQEEAVEERELQGLGEALATGPGTDDLELGLELPGTGTWGCELGLVEEKPAPCPCPSPQALFPRLGWDDELQKPGAQVYMHFLQEHTCYDAMATNSKLVIFDTTLEIKKAFFALVANGIRAAPLWDSKKQSFVGMLTITDFILVLHRYYRSPLRSTFKAASSPWSPSPPTTGSPPPTHLSLLALCSPPPQLPSSELNGSPSVAAKATSSPFWGRGYSVFPRLLQAHRSHLHSLFEAVYTLIKNRIHRLPVLDPVSGAVLHILTHKRLLKFLHIFGALLPQPSFLSRTIQDLGIGTFRDLAVVLDTAPILTALDIFVDRRVSALPVVNEAGQVVGLYSRFDVIHLAARQTYNHLDISVGEALKQRTLCLEGVLSCQPHESLGEVIDRIAREQVHRLVLVDETRHLLGVVSLSDILQALVLSPAGIEALRA
ncbi:hypothetical protein MC885_009743 [Smutsia gigantea]|nr:hypothetical protein MC885_009743 [Smutsia gigantea]